MENIIQETATKKTKKKFRKTLTIKLEQALIDLKNGTSEKDFSAALKKAGKLLTTALYVKEKKKKDKKKKEKRNETTEGLVM